MKKYKIGISKLNLFFNRSIVFSLGRWSFVQCNYVNVLLTFTTLVCPLTNPHPFSPVSRGAPRSRKVSDKITPFNRQAAPALTGRRANYRLRSSSSSSVFFHRRRNGGPKEENTHSTRYLNDYCSRGTSSVWCSLIVSFVRFFLWRSRRCPPYLRGHYSSL